VFKTEFIFPTDQIVVDNNSAMSAILSLRLFSPEENYLAKVIFTVRGRLYLLNDQLILSPSFSHPSPSLGPLLKAISGLLLPVRSKLGLLWKCITCKSVPLLSPDSFPTLSQMFIFTTCM
jgi:hypothetical protein